MLIPINLAYEVG